MHFSIIFVFLTCLVQTACYTINKFHRIRPIVQDISQKDSLLNCSQYVNDDEIHRSFPFPVNFNLLEKSLLVTQGRKDANGNIVDLSIINEQYVPSSIFCLWNLQRLYVQNTRFLDSNYGLPVAIENLAASLIHLEIHNTPVTHLPERIGKLKHLKILELFNTGLIELPNSINYLSSLTHLKLANNKLTSLPMTIRNTPLLYFLDLTNNSHLSSIQSLNGHQHLKILQTNNCPIECIPRNLPQLTYLWMSNNSLTDLFSIQTLGNQINDGKQFLFDKNHIRHVPPQIRQVKNLVLLKLSGNRLYGLPYDIYKITTLQYLYIEKNSINNQDLTEIVRTFKTTHIHLKFQYSPQESI